MRSCPAIRAHCRQGSVGMVHYVLNDARNPAGDQDRIERQAVIQAASPVVQVVQTVLVWVLLRACAVSGLDLDCPFTFGGLGLATSARRRHSASSASTRFRSARSCDGGVSIAV